MNVNFNFTKQLYGDSNIQEERRDSYGVRCDLLLLTSHQQQYVLLFLHMGEKISDDGSLPSIKKAKPLTIFVTPFVFLNFFKSCELV